MMQTFRKSMRLILFIVVAAFALLIFFEWGLNVTGIRATPETDIAKIDGNPVSYTDYLKYVQSKENETKGITRDEIWSEMIEEIVWGNLIRKERLGTTDDEIWAIIRSNPPREIYESEHMKNEKGEFDYKKYLELLSLPQSRQWLMEYEYRIRRELPREKLRSLITTMGWVSPFEDSVTIVKLTTIYSFSFISMPLFRARPLAQITDEELSDYYNKNIKDFLFPSSKILKYIFFERRPSAADTLEAREKIEDFVERIKEGEDFLKVAEEVSDDSIIEQKFSEEIELLPYVANIYKNLKNGEISEIFKGPNGFEIIKKVKKGMIYRVKTNIEVSRATIEDIYDKIEVFKEAVKERGFDVAAEELGIPVRKTMPMNPEKVNFPLRNTDGLAKFLLSKNINEIAGPFSSLGGYYLFAVDSVIPQQKQDFDELKPMVKARYEREKYKEVMADYLQNIYNQLTSGKTMEDITSRDTLIILQTNIKNLNIDQIKTQYGLEFAGACARLQTKQISLPVITDWAGYIIRVDSISIVPFDSTMISSLQIERQMRLGGLTQTIFTPKKIVDNRDKFFE